MFVFTQKQYSKNFAFCMLEILEMLKNNLIFTKYTNFTGKWLKNSCDKKCKIFKTLCLYEFEYIGKIFKSVLVICFEQIYFKVLHSCS